MASVGVLFVCYTKFMLIILHVIAALGSVTLSAYTFFVPSRTKARASHALILLTLGSGSYLVIRMHSPLQAACTSGLVYLSAVLIASIGTHQKLRSLKKVESTISKNNVTD